MHEIQGAEAHHMLNVMRLTGGASVELFDGRGNVAVGMVEKTTRRSLTVRTGPVSAVDRESPLNLAVGVALPRGDRARFLVEKLTELGVSQLIPLVTVRSTVKSGVAAVDKLRRYVIEASKQCGRNQLMQVSAPARIGDLARCDAVFETRIVLHPGCHTILAADEVRTTRAVAVCIGPEGGWDDSELDWLTAAGWQPRNLGGRILRTETAAIAVASICAVLSSGSSKIPSTGTR